MSIASPNATAIDHVNDAASSLAKANSQPAWTTMPETGPRVGSTTDAAKRDAVRKASDLAVAMLSSEGVAVLDSASIATSVQMDAEEFLNAVLWLMGTPIRVFDDFAFWKPIGVDPSRPPDRSGGTGDQPLHMDFVNAEFPPDIIVLHCVRPDPLGGGFSRYANFEAAVEKLTAKDRHALKVEVFRDGHVRNLSEVGADINPFPVLAAGSRRYRFTGNLVGSDVPSPQRSALVHLAEILTAGERQIRLDAGATLFINNRTTVHSRGRLGDGQDQLIPDQRRLLVQGFVRMEAHL